MHGMRSAGINGVTKLVSSWLVLGWLACGSLLARAQGLPDGSGKEAIEASCTLCHGLSYITQSNKSLSGWRDIVSDMMARGAPLTKEEFEAVLPYLATHFGPKESSKVNVNKASAKELETALAISAREAEAIVRYREQNQAFRTWEDVKKVPGMDPKKIEAGKDRLAF